MSCVDIRQDQQQQSLESTLRQFDPLPPLHFAALCSLCVATLECAFGTLRRLDETMMPIAMLTSTVPSRLISKVLANNNVTSRLSTRLHHLQQHGRRHLHASAASKRTATESATATASMASDKHAFDTADRLALVAAVSLTGGLLALKLGSQSDSTSRRDGDDSLQRLLTSSSSSPSSVPAASASAPSSVPISQPLSSSSISQLRFPGVLHAYCDAQAAKSSGTSSSFSLSGQNSCADGKSNSNAKPSSPSQDDADNGAKPPNSAAGGMVGLSRYAVADAVDKVLPSVVNIRRVTTARPSRGFFGWDSPFGGFVGGGNDSGGGSSGALDTFGDGGEAIQVSCGSGFFINADGLILTNAHVVRGPSSSSPLLSSASPYDHDDYSNSASEADESSVLHVTLSDGELYIGRIVAVDEASDIALVKIAADRPTPFADMGDSDNVRPGEFVVAVGSPLTLANSVSFGVISMIRRDLFQSHSPAPPPYASRNSSRSSSNSNHSSAGAYTPVSMSDPVPSGLTYLQLDVAINQGSSGGPCVSLDGRVIGMCSMKLAGDAEGIAFAIPIRYAARVVSDLQQFGYVRRPYVGLTLISVTPQLFDEIRMDNSYRPARWLESQMRTVNSAKSVGLMVHYIFPGGPGDSAGLKPGDVIVQVNGAQTLTTSEFLAALAFNVQRECTITVRRAATGVTDHVTLTPEALNSPRQPQPDSQGGRRR